MSSSARVSLLSFNFQLLLYMRYSSRLSLSSPSTLVYFASHMKKKEEEESMRPETDISGDIVGSLSLFFGQVDDEAELSPEFPIKEEKIEEKMKELYEEISCSSRTNVSLIPLPSSFPSQSLSPMSSPSSSSLSLPSLPFDVKGESCGASISDSGSTVMAGIKFVGPPENIASDNKNNGFGEKMDGYDVLEAGDEWLARVLRWVSTTGA